MRRLAGDDPRLALLPPGQAGGRRRVFALPDGRLLMLASEEIGVEESIELTLHAPDGRMQARLRRGLVYGGGFLGEPVPAGDWAVDFTFPDAVAWRAEVRRRPAWLGLFGAGPLVLRRRSG